MIIWGSKNKATQVGDGVFFCPSCRGETGYRFMRVARYFTLYFIPLFQTQQLGEYVNCDRCDGNFKPEILTWRPQGHAAAQTAPPPAPPPVLPRG